MSEWQPIEAANLDGGAVLLYCPGITSWNRATGMPDIVVGIWEWGYDRRNGQWVSDVGEVNSGYESTGAYFEREALRPTHWMPLPELPPTPADSAGVLP